jgi:hypothetical protein
MIAALGAVMCACSETFADQIREHRGCISVAQIAPARVDACMRNTNGRRERVNVCLVNDMVPDRKIRILNDASTPASTRGIIREGEQSIIGEGPQFDFHWRFDDVIHFY